MLLSHDPDKISCLKILLNTISNINNTKFTKNNQQFIYFLIIACHFILCLVE